MFLVIRLSGSPYQCDHLHTQTNATSPLPRSSWLFHPSAVSEPDPALSFASISVPDHTCSEAFPALASHLALDLLTLRNRAVLQGSSHLSTQLHRSSNHIAYSPSFLAQGADYHPQIWVLPRASPWLLPSVLEHTTN